MENIPPEELFDEPPFKRGRGKKRINRRETAKVDDNFDLRLITPKTDNQARVFENYDRGFNLLLKGSAGTGKSFVSIYLALRTIMERRGKFKRIAIVRSAVPTRDIGFLPGTTKEKLAVYEAPYVAIFAELFGRADAYAIMKLKKVVEFIPTSFIRGTTLNDTIIIVDEMQNMSLHETDSIITRVGDNSKIIFCGDYMQSDFVRESDKNGMKEFSKVLDQMKSFRTVDFSEDDIVRSGIVKDYIITKNRLGISA
jgi:phosphate starvation-inducible protein PhoH